ncbi:MAG: radical SAM protein [bacterium]
MARGGRARSAPCRSGDLISWDVEQGISLVVRRGDHLILIELEQRDESLDCYVRTDRFNVCARRHFAATEPLDDADRRIVDGVVRVVRRREQRLPVFDRPTTTRRLGLREIEVDRVLIPEGAGHYYLNPYVGCLIGCEFCYVAPRADFSRQLEGLPHLPWGRYVDVKVNAPEVLRREVTHLPPGIVRLSPIVTDPYQSIERSYRITRQCLEVLLPAGFTPVILTRAALVLDDLPLLRQFPRASVGFSIPSDDDHMRQLIEPGADPIPARIEALAKCHAAGLHTTAVIQPVLPMINPTQLAATLAPIIHAVRIDRMHHVHRYLHLYQRHNLEHAADPAFFADLIPRLQAAFRTQGVPIDELDDLARLLASTC